MKTRLPARVRGAGLPLLLAAGLASAAAPVIEERAATRAAPVPAASPAPAAAGGDAAVAVFEQLQQYQAQIEALTGRVEQLEHQLAQSREQQRAQYVDLDARLGALQQAPVAAPAAAVAEPAPVVAAPAAGGAATGDEKSLYERAQALVRDKKFDDAIKAFEFQLKQYPRGDLTPQAMYWLGELWLAAAAPDAPKAGRYFFRVYNEYPKHARAPVSMYKHGLIQCQTGETPKGRLTLNRLIIGHAGTPDAKLGEAALKQQCQ